MNMFYKPSGTGDRGRSALSASQRQKAFAKAGSAPILADVDEAAISTLAEELTKAGHSAIASVLRCWR